MGSTSKPLHIQVEQSLYDATQSYWSVLKDQGHQIEVIGGTPPDIYFGPRVMRLTADMVTQLPNSLEVAIKGARALRYSPTGTKEWKKGTTRAKAKTPSKRKNSAKQVEVVDPSEPGTSNESHGPGATTGVEGQSRDTTNTGGYGQV